MKSCICTTLKTGQFLDKFSLQLDFFTKKMFSHQDNYFEGRYHLKQTILLCFGANNSDV